MNWYKQIKFAYRIEDNGHSGTLVISPNDSHLVSMFEFQTDNSYMEIRLNPLSPNFGGMVYPSASYIAISVSNQPGNEVENQVVSQLMNQISGLPEPKWDMGTNPMIDMLNKATGKYYTDDPDEVNMTEIPETEVLPLPSSIEVKTSPTLKIIRCGPGNARYIINNILRNLEQIIQPFLQHNLIDYYAISSSSYGKKFIRSEKFQQSFDEMQDKTGIEIGYLKYVFNIVLEKYPHLKREYAEWLNKWYPYVGPQSNTKVDLRSSDIVQNTIVDKASQVGRIVIKAIINFNENKLKEMERLHQLAENKKISINSIESLLYWLDDENIQKLLRSIQNDHWVYFTPSFLKQNIVELMRELGFEYDKKINLLKYTVENLVPELIKQNNIYIIKEKILPIYQDLDLSPEIMKILEDFQKEIKKQEMEKKKKEEERRKKSTFVLNWYAAFMNLKDNRKFTRVPDQYLDWGDTVVIQNFVVEKPEIFPWYNNEDAWYGAVEEAEQELREEMGPRPSDIYGKDREEVIDDIKFYADDFVSDVVPDQAEEFYERYGDSQEKLAELVGKNMYDEFVDWRQESMREDEGSWEVSSYELAQKAREVQENNVNEDEAFEHGLLIAYNKPDKLEIWVHSKYLDNVKSILKQLREVNKDKDTSLSLSWPVEIYFTDKNNIDRKSLYGWIVE